MNRKPNITDKEVPFNKGAIGKTIKDFCGSDSIFVITFTDGTFSTLFVHNGPGDEIVVFPQFLIDKDYPITSLDNIINFGIDILVNIGAFSEKEMDDIIDDLKKREKKFREERERMQCQKLKKKFGI